MAWVVYEVVYGSDVDGTGPERWRGMEVGRFDTEDEADDCAYQQNEECEVEREDD